MMTTSDLRERLSAAKVGQFFNICVDAIIYAERLEADLRSKGDECRHYAEKGDHLESERDSWRRISERLEAENKRLASRCRSLSRAITEMRSRVLPPQLDQIAKRALAGKEATNDTM